MEIKDYIERYLQESKKILEMIDRVKIEQVIKILRDIKNNKGRLFILGVGGSASNASHAVNDFRKIAGIESYTPVDNVAELTAWTNDAGFEFIFINWLKTSRLNKHDAIMVLSVGGGTETTSKNLILAMDYAKEVGAKIVSIVSRDGGRAALVSDVCIVIPPVEGKRITPHAESWQGLLLHLIVNAIVEEKI
ncbi:MAG: SIS domain-containing protein [Candidatus Omnitrophica bacterium]|nr:SIS domain-containing protein [Candidatus Omnitrophota bacterium]